MSQIRDPFEYEAPPFYPVRILRACVVEDQMRIVRTADIQKLRDILAWQLTGATVRKAAASRLRRLERANAEALPRREAT